MKNNGRIVTLQEASKITGIKISTLRMRIKSGKLEGFKIAAKHGEAWAIKADNLNEIERLEHGRLNVQEGASLDGSSLQGATLHGENQNPIIEAHKEHIRTLQNTLQNYEGLLTTFHQRIVVLEEEKGGLEGKLKMLPAPVEVVAEELRTKEEALQQAQKILHQAQEVKERYKASLIELKQKLQEEERAKEAFRIQWELAQAELKKPWWKKLFGMR